MRNPLSCIRSLAVVRDTRGANMVEYIVIVGLVAIVAIAGFTAFGGDVTNAIKGQGNTVTTIPSASP